LNCHRNVTESFISTSKSYRFVENTSIMKLNYLFFALLLGVIMISCGDSEPEPEACDSPDITYTNGAAAILNASCATTSCHSDTALAGGFSLVGYTQASTAAGFGRMVGAINHSDGFSAMPPSGTKIADCDIEKITAWIAAGAPE